MKLLRQNYFLLILSIILLTACTNSSKPIAELDTKTCVFKTTTSKNYFISMTIFYSSGSIINKEIKFAEEGVAINSFNLCKILKASDVDISEINLISITLEKKKSWFSISKRTPKPTIHFIIKKEQLSRIGTDEKLFFYSTLK